MQEAIRDFVIEAAQYDGDRVVVDGKTIWAGLGSRAGLHSYQHEVIKEKWTKSGANFIKKLDKIKAGSKIEVQTFANQTRDRGRWVVKAMWYVK